MDMAQEQSQEAQLSKEPRPLFLYGTLLAPSLLAWLLTGDYRRVELIHSLTEPATLRGFARHPIFGADYPALVHSLDPTHSVEGLLLRPENLSQRRKADDFEGETYRIEQVSVRVGSKDVEADAYVWQGDPDLVDNANTWDPLFFQKERSEDWLEIFSGMEMVGQLAGISR